jgi:hypothetical protein
MATIPTDLLTLKARFDEWRTGRKYKREPIPDDLRQAVVKISSKVSRAQIRNILKVDPGRLLEQKTKKPPRRSIAQTEQTAFFELPFTAGLPTTESIKDCRLLLERPDGARLTLTLPVLDLASINQLCVDFLRG